jgi:hypothetical protein
VVDLAIASNFARELTEEQFAEPRGRHRRTAAPGRTGDGTVRATRKSVRATRVGRTLSRLAQVRG